MICDSYGQRPSGRWLYSSQHCGVVKGKTALIANEMTRRELNVHRQWRITIKSNDEVDIDFEEPFAGPYKDAIRRARIMWARTSYVVNSRRHRVVYTLLEVWDQGGNEYRKVWEHKGKLPDGALAPGAS